MNAHLVASVILLATCAGAASARADDALPPPPPVAARSVVAPAVVLAVLAAGGIGSGIAFQVVSSSNNSEATALRAGITARHGTCIPDVGGYDAKCPQLQGKVNTSVAFGDAAACAFVVGGGLAVASAALGLWASRSPKVAPVQVTPVVGPGRASIVIGRAF